MKIATRLGVEFVVDEQDVPLISGYAWRLDHGYIRTKGQYLHRLILGNPPGVVDHIDGNPLNNKRENLRICTQKQNTRNKRVSVHSSKYKGVSWLKRDNKWYACINKDYKTYRIGYYDNEMEAAKAYDKKAVEFFGEYAKTNFV